MDIKDVRTDREKLEDNLCSLLKEFESKTDTRINGFEIFRSYCIGGDSEITKCSLELGL